MSNITLKELVKQFGEDATIDLSLYTCGNTYLTPVTQDRISINKETNGIIIDAEDN